MSAVRRLRRTFFEPLVAAASFGRAGITSPGAGPLDAGPVRSRAHSVRDTHPLRRSLRASVTEGMFAELVTAFSGGAIVTAWGLHVEAPPALLGLLVALPYVAHGVQLPAAWLTARFGARRTAIVAVSLSRQLLLPLALLPLLSVGLEAKRSLLVAIMLASALLGVIGNNAWVDWMGTLVPERIRGRYFGRRTALGTAAGAVGSLVAGGILDVTGGPHDGIGLSILTVLACIAGLVTTALMRRQHHPGETSRELTLRQIAISAWAPMRSSSGRRVVAYLAAWNGAVGLAGGFFAAHMVQNLGMNFSLVALHGTVTAGVRVLAAPFWGRLVDRVGVKPVLVGVSLAISLIPAWWLLPRADRLWPVVVDCIVAGILWSGHAIAAFQLPLVASPKEGRSFHLAVFAMAGGLAFFVATGIGGTFATFVQHSFGEENKALPFHAVFLASSLARFTAGIVALRLPFPGKERVPAPATRPALEAAAG